MSCEPEEFEGISRANAERWAALTPREQRRARWVMFWTFLRMREFGLAWSCVWVFR
jgi:hypothetical protein